MVRYGAAMAPTASPATRRRPGRPLGGQPVIDRAALIDAAIAAVRLSGADTTMDDIARSAGVGKPVVYRYLGDRAAVAEALSTWLTERVNTATVGAIDTTAEPRHALRDAVSGFVTAVDAERGVFLYVNAGGHDVAVWDRLLRAAASPLATLLTGVHPPASALTRAMAVVGALQVCLTAWVVEPHCTNDQLVDDLVDVLWSGLSASVG